MYKNTLLIFLICFSLSNCDDDPFQLKKGDLLFQKWDSSDFAKAINKVTEGYGENDFAHIGMVIEVNKELKVFEATMANGVALNDIDDFLNASKDEESGKPLVAVGRLKSDLSNEIPKINKWLLDHLDKAYDTLFIYGNEKYYCSELIHDAFNSNSKREIFKLQPMTFKDPDTETFFPIWTEYFSSANASIPEGKPGINPGLMSRSKEIQIVKEYFR